MSRNEAAHRDSNDFDPSAPGGPGRLWGLPFDVDSAALVILPVPWEATVSYGAGTASAPEAVLAASAQVDLYDSARPDAWKAGIAMAPIPAEIRRESDRAREMVLRILEGDAGTDVTKQVNAACERMVARVRNEAEQLLSRGKRVGLLGGDHSTALGLMQALSDRHRSFGILHIDAHCDLRKAYEGFVHSHASILRNALEIDAVRKLVQIGVRDTCEEERRVIDDSAGRIRLFEDRALARRRFSGEAWASVVNEIVEELPQEVYVSFDIDGLDPSLCPSTGTPVPGGLSYEEALFLVERVLESGRSIIGFDLCEVAPGRDGSEWDANVGARVLYRLSCATLDAGA
ncbi:MAG TPA: agmatinase family protein [Vicinamibacteria bacterium]|nr:agmatinase family protein [Vicinamibacteria bacterium]